MNNMNNITEEIFTIKIEESFDSIILDECDTLWKKNITNKLNVSTNYYNLSVDNREKLLSLIKEWSTTELKKVNKIRTNNRPIVTE
jgi:hypothetical protein